MGAALRAQPFAFPITTDPLIANTVVQATWLALPELDLFRHDSVATPERRSLNVGSLEAFGDFGQTFLQLVATRNR